VVRLAAGRDEVEAVIFAVEDNSGPELLVGAHASFELFGHGAGQCDRIPLDDDVDVEVRLAEQDVADRAADEVYALVRLVDRNDRVERRSDALRELERRHCGVILPCGLAHFWRTSAPDTCALPRYDRIGEEVFGYQGRRGHEGRGRNSQRRWSGEGNRLDLDEGA
jgi:hypothetical protein